MIFRNLDGSGDWTFGRGKNDYLRDEKAVEMNMQTRLLSWVGDCFFAPLEGVDWRARLDIGQQADLEEELKSVLLQSHGVTGVNSLSATFVGATRNMTITYDVQTIYSPSFQREILISAGSLVGG
jgi:hypothetical protein